MSTHIDRMSSTDPTVLPTLGPGLQGRTAGMMSSYQLMGTQVWTARFATAFPEPDWNRASKTGTLNPWRGEFGIVSRADGATFALAVAVRRHHRRTPGVSIDSAVSAVASSAVALSEVDDNPACTSRQ